MRPHRPGTAFRGIVIGLIVLGILSLAHANPARSESILPQLTPTTPPPIPIYLPLTMHKPLPPVELKAAWTEDEAGSAVSAFQDGDAIQYVVQIANNRSQAIDVDLVWTQEGPGGGGSCGEVLIYSQKVTFNPGLSEYVYTGSAPSCFGVYTNTVQATYMGDTLTTEFQFALPTPSVIEVGDEHGFDKCSLPTVEQMQIWWDESPYYTVNLYIGGISLACKDPKLGGPWIYEVNQQGWNFILTWVGPQAPCTGFKHRMESDAGDAYQEGRDEAGAAVEAARKLGFFGQRVIYYDVEYYGGTNASDGCRDTVAAFIEGWTKRIHELGFKAGGYGGSWGSNVADWWSNNPRPDDVWLAYWNKSAYDPDVSVWGAPGVSDGMWADHQRIKQYTGGHQETWGDLTFTIDSDVLDGEVNSFQAITTAHIPFVLNSPADSLKLPTSAADPLPENILAQGRSQIRAMGLLSPEAGWALVGNRLLLTNDGSSSWQDVTPEGLSGDILGVYFLNPGLAPDSTGQGWLVSRSAQSGESAGLSVLRTVDAGRSWEALSLPLSPEEAPSIAAAYSHFIDEETGWLALKLQSGSNFSLGWLFATHDGGQTWEERSLPLGEPVRFVDPLNGWVAGGPASDQLFRTQDGGQTWEALSLPLEGDFDAAYPGLPQFADAQHGRLPVTLTGADGSSLILFATADGGETWSLDTTLNLGTEGSPAAPLPFDLAADRSWKAASSDSSRLYRTESGEPAVSLPTSQLSGSIVELDFSSGDLGWALVQEGACTGTKLPNGVPMPPGSEPLSCEQRTRLMATTDGGYTWQEVSPPD